MILVTGSNGFLGKALVKRLREQKYDVIEFSRGGVIDNRFSYDIVINCAASIHSTKGESLFKDNIQLPYDLISKVNTKKFIQIGSSSEYGPTVELRKEDLMLNPTTLYEGTKAAASMLVLGLGRSLGIEVAVARPFSVYGPGMSGRMIPYFIKRISSGDPLRIYQGAHDWIYIDDFVDGIMSMFHIKIDGIYNFCTEINVTNYKVASLIAEILNITPQYIITDSRYRAYDVDFWTGYATKKLLWKPNVTLKEGLEKCIKDSIEIN